MIRLVVGNYAPEKEMTIRGSMSIILINNHVELNWSSNGLLNRR